MATLTSSFVSTRNPKIQSFAGSTFEPMDQCLVNLAPAKLSFNTIHQKKARISTSKRPLVVRAAYRYRFPHYLVYSFSRACLDITYIDNFVKLVAVLLVLTSSLFKTLALGIVSGDGGRPGSASIFVGGFILGGIVVGTLGCVYAPQCGVFGLVRAGRLNQQKSAMGNMKDKALAGADKKDLMRKLPKFIYDEEKALEKTRKILTEKIAQLNSAIDDVSSQLRTEDSPNGAASTSDEIEAAV
ncbi:hypothetical protein C5167_017037 [Papaver somniferum]|uniref:Uncharacterized protein n=2 Tax=Papaver TaxID=3468 RepID=A0A4Y7ILK2_PAPSO|nr:hypothetical protein C5167_017037 [Papaver somniferum]